MAYNTGPASSAMGLQPSPAGTLDEIRKAGLDPRVVGCCHPKVGNGIAGCAYYERCIFRFRKNGGFRDQGPKNVGYFLRTHEGNQKEDENSCHWFMSRLDDRRFAGERDRREGLQGEIIEVVAQEGEVIHKQMVVNVNEGTGKPADYRKKSFAVKVSEFPRPGSVQSIAYDTLLEDRRRLREAQDESLLEGPAHRVSPDDIEEPVVMSVEDVVSAAPEKSAPVAAPVEKKGRG